MLPKDSGLKKLVYALVVVNVFDRKTYTRAVTDKKPATIRDTMKSIVDSAPEKPYTISSDKGEEFASPAMGAYLDSQGIKRRFKEAGDPNALGVVDKAIQTLKNYPSGTLTRNQHFEVGIMWRVQCIVAGAAAVAAAAFATTIAIAVVIAIESKK